VLVEVEELGLAKWSKKLFGYFVVELIYCMVLREEA
jgi:hypothetical protein